MSDKSKTIIQERPRFVDRAIHAAGATLGSSEAKGRLSTRIMADRMMKAWKLYKGAAGVEPTRRDVYQFLNRHYGNAVGSSEVRKVVGMPAAANAGQNGAPVSPQQQGGGGGGGGAAATPSPSGGAGSANSATPTAKPAQPQQQSGAPSPAAATPSAAAATPATPASPAASSPSSPAPATAPTPPAGQPLVRASSDIEKQDNVSPAEANRRQQKEFLAVSDYQAQQRANNAASASSPSSASAAAPPARTPPAPAATTPAPATPAASPQATATAAPTSPAQPPAATPTAPAPAAPPASPARPQPRSPTASRAVPPPAGPTFGPYGRMRGKTQPTAAPAQGEQPQQAPQQPQGVNWQDFTTGLGTMVNQPQVDQRQVMNFIAKAASQARTTSPADRQKMVQIITALQKSPKMQAKVPMIKQISLENIAPKGTVLHEKDLTAPSRITPNDKLDKRALDDIFIKMARALVMAHKEEDDDDGSADQQQQQPDDQGQQQQQNDPMSQRVSKAPTDTDFQDMFDRSRNNLVIKKPRLQRSLIQGISPKDMRNGGDTAFKKLQDIQKTNQKIDLRTWVEALGKDNIKWLQLPISVKDAMIKLARDPEK